MSVGGKILNTGVDIATLGGDRLLSSGGATGLADTLSGQNPNRVTPTTIGEYDPAAEEQYRRDYDNWVAQQNWMRTQYADHPQDMPNVPPPTPPVVDPTAKRLYQDRAAQMGLGQEVQAGYRPLVSQLQDAAAGNGPSQAQGILKEGTARAQAGAYSTAASAPVQGAQAAAMMSQAQQQATGAEMQGARAASQLRAQEMTDARSQLGQTLSGMGNTGENIYGNMGQQDLTRGQGNVNALNRANETNVGIEGQNAANKQQFAKDVVQTGGMLAAHSDIRSKQDIQPLGRPGNVAPTPLYFDGGDNFLTAPQQQQHARDTGYAGTNMEGMPASIGYRSTFSPALPAALTQPGDSSAAFGAQPASMIVSDEHSKDKLRALEGQLAVAKLGLDQQAGQIRGTRTAAPVLQDPSAAYPGPGLSDGTRSALSTVQPYQYRYKPDTAARIGEDTGPRIGIMAQDLERSPNPAVRSTVINTPQGKAIDSRRGLSLALASSAGLDKRVGAIEDALNQPTQYPTIGRGAYR